MLDAANDRMYLVHGDHLGTPKSVTDAARDVVWSGEARRWRLARPGSVVC